MNYKDARIIHKGQQVEKQVVIYSSAWLFTKVHLNEQQILRVHINLV